VRRRIDRLVLCAVAAVVAAGCSDGSGAEPSVTQATTAATATIAATTPTTATTGTTAATPARPTPTTSGTGCATPGTAAVTGCWQQVLPLGSGGFPPAPGSQNTPLWEPGLFPLTLTPHVAFGGQLWMVAQVHSYSSPDGLVWTQHDKTDWGERIYQSIVYFDDQLWMYGGMDYEARTFSNEIWSSTDGATWTPVGTAAWPGRGGHTMVVFDDQLWLFGGADHAGADRGLDGFMNDVWVSDDGVEWRQVTAAAPWTARALPGVVVLGGELYLIGGDGHADVWKSSNGADWTQLTAAADWMPRMGYGRAVFAGRLWVLGGWVDRTTNALNDVWYSTDGVAWHRQGEHAPWGPRSPVVAVFDDTLWIFSGKHTGASDNWGGDLWQMSATPTSSGGP
jgi:hypothetical protein